VLQLALRYVRVCGRGRDMVMSAADRVMVCYRDGERVGKGDVCCS